jgi:hypothetical protein
MNTSSLWEAETRELLSRIEREMHEIEADSEKRLSLLQEKRWALLQTLEAYSEYMGSQEVAPSQLLNPSDIKNKSYREILRLIAERSDGRLFARNAIKLMEELNVFGDSPNADSIVYAVLNRSPEFVKLGSGLYRLNGTKIQTKAKTKRRKRRGLTQVIKELKKRDPEMTKKRVKNYLIKHQFDFQGKNPKKAINMAWTRLGYSKRAKEAHQAALIK